MRKWVVGLILIMILGTLSCQVFAADETYRMELEIKNNTKNEDVEIYILLPQEYIEFAIDRSPTWAQDHVTYEGAKTLKYNDVEGIEVKKENVQDKTYKEGNVEYVQIKLEPNLNNKYVFDILSDYEEMNIKFRIKNDYKDYIMHIDNFKIEKDICEIEYNYDKDIVKQPDIKKLSTPLLILFIVLTFITILGYISYKKS